jgi:hypothetical protein
MLITYVSLYVTYKEDLAIDRIGSGRLQSTLLYKPMMSDIAAITKACMDTIVFIEITKAIVDRSKNKNLNT